MRKAVSTGDEVAVWVPGLTRPLYGVVTECDGTGKVAVHVYSGRGEKMLSVDEAICAPWHPRQSKR